jgi:hypothetical protein
VPHNRRDKSGRCDRIAKEEKEDGSSCQPGEKLLADKRKGCFTVVKKKAHLDKSGTQRKKMKIHI